MFGFIYFSIFLTKYKFKPKRLHKTKMSSCKKEAFSEQNVFPASSLTFFSVLKLILDQSDFELV